MAFHVQYIQQALGEGSSLGWNEIAFLHFRENAKFRKISSVLKNVQSISFPRKCEKAYFRFNSTYDIRVEWQEVS